MKYEKGGARTVKHAKLPISSFDQPVSARGADASEKGGAEKK